MPSVFAILLSAGRSERMGAFKPLLPFGEKTVIETSVDYLRRGGVETIIVVLGHRAEELKELLKSQPVSFALNPNPKSEMNESIACGVRELPERTKATLIALVDHPAIPAEVVSRLITEWERGAKLLIPENKGRGGHPVLVDLCYREELLQLDPERGLRGLLDAHRAEVVRVPVESPYIARDMDTWDDYRALHREIFGSDPPAAV
jgi:molybdenum cofactor cytidylyltransferase